MWSTAPQGAIPPPTRRGPATQCKMGDPGQHRDTEKQPVSKDQTEHACPRAGGRGTPASGWAGAKRGAQAWGSPGMVEAL